MTPDQRFKRWLAVMLLLCAAAALVMLLSILLGERSVPPLEAMRTLLGKGRGEYDYTIMTLRLPRAIVGFLAGGGLAVAGAILQGIMRNPLASPGVLGLNSGAAAAAVAIIVLVPSFPMKLLPIVAFGGALAAAALIYVLSWRKGSSPVRLLLVGIGVSAVAGAFITYLLMSGGIFRVSQASVWMAGSLYGRTWEHADALLPWLAALFVLSLLLSRHLDVLQFEDNHARGLGIHLERARGIGLLVSVGLAGAAVSMAGTIGFVGLMAPHICRSAVGVKSRLLLPASLITGGLLVMTADLLGRTLFAPYEIPVGIMTAIIGAPYMIYLLFRR
jgi:iron complex transport system permease protein